MKSYILAKVLTDKTSVFLFKANEEVEAGKLAGRRGGGGGGGGGASMELRRFITKVGVVGAEVVDDTEDVDTEPPCVEGRRLKSSRRLLQDRNCDKL